MASGVRSEAVSARPRLTEKQRQALDLIRDLRRPRCPTIRQIGEALGQSSSCSTYRTLAQLERKGYLRRVEGQGYRDLIPVEEEIE